MIVVEKSIWLNVFFVGLGLGGLAFMVIVIVEAISGGCFWQDHDRP